MVTRLALVFLGGGIGSLLRYLVAGIVHRFGGESFPLGTLSVNLVGCAAIGFFAAAFTGPVLVREEFRLLLLVGVLGGFTTFSTFGWETLTLSRDGQFMLAAVNVLASNALGLAAVWLGSRVAVAIYGA